MILLFCTLSNFNISTLLPQGKKKAKNKKQNLNAVCNDTLYLTYLSVRDDCLSDGIDKAARLDISPLY